MLSTPATSTDPAASPASTGVRTLAAPSLKRRLAAFMYEGVLLFGVVMIVGLLYGLAAQQRHALQGHAGLQWTMFLVLGLYFSWFWSRSGQTVATQAWHLRVVDARGQPVRFGRAVWRYLWSWLWFLPALLSLSATGLRSGAMVWAVLLVGVLGYAGLVWLRADRQFLHDVLAGTRVVDAKAFPPPGHRPARVQTSHQP